MTILFHFFGLATVERVSVCNLLNANVEKLQSPGKNETEFRLIKNYF